MVRFEIKLPKLDEIQETATIKKWHVKIGDRIKKGDKIATIETLKVNYDIEAENEGIVLEIRYKEGDTVAVGEVICIIGDETSVVTTSANISEKKEIPSQIQQVIQKQEQGVTPTSKGEEIRAMPTARKLAREKGVDLRLIKGTGPGGVITVKDVEEYLKALEKPYRIEPLTPIRLSISEKMTKAHEEIPTARLTIKICMDNLLRKREELKEKYGEKPSLTALLLKEVAKVLRKYPKFNSVYINKEWRIYNKINIAVAIQSKHGLVTPVIKNVDLKEYNEISKEIEIFQKKADENNLSLEDIKEGTFTITNLGPYDIIQFDPIINYPQVAILAIGTIFKELELTESGLIFKNYSYFTLAFDHRILDGYDAAIFLKELKETIENLQ